MVRELNEKVKRNNMAYYQKNNPLRKSSPAKGKIGDFIKNIGSQLKQGQKERGIFSEKHKEYMKDKEAGESKYEYNVRKKREGLKAERAETKRRKNDPLLDEIKDTSELEVGEGIVQGPKPKLKPKPKPESKGDYHTFSGKKGDKFKYRYKSDGGDFDFKTTYEFQRPGSDVWETSKTKAGGEAIHDLYVDDYEGRNVEITPIEKVSPYKKGIGKYTKKAKGKRGYKMKRK